MRPVPRLIVAATLALAAPAAARGGERLVVERTVMVMRHGVRAPLAVPPMPDGTAARPWRRWPVGRAELTPHGAAAVRLLGAADRGLLPAAAAAWACPPASLVTILADNDQRTVATARAWADGLAPGCALAVASTPGRADPLFAAIEAGVGTYDPADATQAVAAGLPAGGLAAVDRRRRSLLARLDAVLCGPAPVLSCGVAGTATALHAGSPGREPSLTGALARGATAAQILTLEYADGAPLAETGWGKVTPADLAAFGALRADGYALVQRAPYVARAFGGPMLRRMAIDLTAADGPALLVMVGHDSNIAAVAGLLDLHWRAPGYAADDPPPGGALGLQRLRDDRGRLFVRAIFRAASLHATRDLEAVDGSAATAVLPIAACRPTPTLCPLDRFAQIVKDQLEP